MRRVLLPWALFLALLSESCGLFAPDCETKYPPLSRGSARITEGVFGDVWFWQGDFMPVCPTGIVRPVMREVLFYELTGLDSVVWTSPGGFYTEVKSRLVGSTRSNTRGFFEIDLPPDTYSVFVREDSLLYSNHFDGDRHVFPVVVKQGGVTRIRVHITYASSE